jgi:hypothetical protein
MSRIPIFESEFITVEYLSDKKIISHVIHKPVGGQHFRDALNAGTDALIERGACKWLSDDRKNGPLSPEDAEWGFNIWNARTIKGGWKYWAVIVPPDVVAAGSLIPTINDLFEMGLRMMVFSDPAEAMAWLDSMKD